MRVREKPRILVVEDEEEVAGILGKLLERRLSALVTTATSARQAREALSSGRFDVITLDHQLPDATGLELLEEISSLDEHPPVVMVTGHGNEEVASLAIQGGAVGYVRKDDKMGTVLPQIIEDTLAGSVLIDAVEAVRESEEFYRTLFRESTSGLYIETIDGTIEDVNRAAASILGYEPEELKGKNALELVPLELVDSFEDAVGSLLAGNVLRSTNLHKDGHRVPVEVSAREVITRKGTRFVVAVRDLSEQGGLEDELNLEREFTDKCLDAIDDAFFILDLDGRLVRWNRTVEQVLGVTAEDLRGVATEAFFAGSDRTAAEASVGRVLRKGFDRIEISALARDGTEHPYEYSMTLIRDGHGDPMAIAVVGRDVGDRKRADEALRNVIRETNERREEITALLESTRFVLEHAEFRAAAGEVFNLCRKLIGARAGFLAVTDRNCDLPQLVIAEPEEYRDSFESIAAAGAVGGGRFADKASFDNALGNDASSDTERSPVESILLAPLLVDGAAAGVIGLANKPGGFSNRDLLMASAFGEIASVALRNSRVMERLASSEERFRSVAMFANEAVILADASAMIRFWNPAAEAIFGYGAEEMIGRPFVSILPEGERRVRLDSFLSVSTAPRGAQGKVYELRGRKRDGTEFPMELSRSTWKVADESYFTIIVRDITERKEAEAALRDSEERYRTLVDHAPDIIYSISMDGTLTTINPAVKEVLGLEPEDMLGRSLVEFIHPGDVRLALETFERAVHGQVTGPYELRVRSAGGEWMVGEFVSTPLVERGEVVGELGVARDVTRRKEVEELVRIEADLAMKLSATAGLPEVLQVILDGVLEVTGLDCGGVYVLDEKTGSLDLVVHKGLSDTFVEGKAHFGPDSENARLVMLGEPIYRRHEELGLPRDDVTAGEGLEFIAVVPIKVQDRVIACLNVASHTRDNLAKDLESMVEILAGQVGQAVARAKLNAAIRESEALYRGLVEASPDGVIVLDAQGIITNASLEAVRMYGGYAMEEVVGRPVSDFVIPEQYRQARENLRDTIARGSVRNVEYTIVRKDGGHLVGEVSSTVIRDESGGPTRVILTVRDVTQRKEAERALQALNNELEGYAHAVSHDLKGPLSSIMAASSTIAGLIRGESESVTLQGIREMSEIIRVNIVKSNDLIDSLLELAEAGQKPWDVEEVDIAEVVEQIIEERAPAIREKKVRVRVEDGLGSVRANRTHMYQLFSNLIDNAIRHNDAKKPLVRVSRVETVGGLRRYRVWDNGPGIDPADAESIFMPFYATAKGNTGVGLATVAKIAGVYSGAVRAFNDEGAVFEVDLSDYDSASS